MQRLHSLFNRSAVVETMAYDADQQPYHAHSGWALTLQQVDVVQLEALKASFDRVEDMLPSRFSIESMERGQNAAHLAVQAMLVDDTNFFGLLSRGDQVDRRVSGDRTVQL